MEYKCCICKQKITSEDRMMNNHNPCALTITTNLEGNVMEQKEQTFFCHFKCFKEFYNDDSTFYLEDIATPLESFEANQLLLNKMEVFTQYLYDVGEDTDLWEFLFNKPSGTWISLYELYKDIADVEVKIMEVQNELSDKLLIMWSDDYSSYKRSKNRIWRVVLITTENYEFPVSLLIGKA
ncbi:MAG: hypothetical protein ACQEXQ_29150 [Bacillota bacterium]